MLLTSLFFVSFAAAQKPKPTPKPPVKPKSIIFAVDNNGKMIEPIAYIDKGKLTDATNSVAGQKSFATNFYKKGTSYTLVFGGANDGKFAVTKSNVGSDCASNRADGTVTAARAKLKGIVMALATNAKVGAGPGVRRLPTAAERTEVEALVKAEFTKQKVSAAMQKDLHYQNLTAIDVDKDGTAELVGSYWLGPSDKDRRLLFFIADKGASGKYSFGYSEYQAVTPDKVMSGEVKDLDDGIYHELLLDSLDTDGDGTNEIFTMIAAFEGNNFHAFRRQGGKWVKTFEAYNYHCAY
jgi:hypothetical protein